MKNNFINPEVIMKALEWAYDRALMSSPFPGVENSHSLAQNYLAHSGTLEQQVDSLIRWQNTKAAAIGFVTGIGGISTLPIMLPGNLASILFVQIRMIAAIAMMGGHDLKEDKVRTLAFACVCGSSTMDIFRSLSIKLGKHAIAKLNEQLIVKLNAAVGMKLVVRSGEGAAISLGKAIPLVGGLIGGSFDAFTTNMVGNAAKMIFIQEDTGS